MVVQHTSTFSFAKSKQSLYQISSFNFVFRVQTLSVKASDPQSPKLGAIVTCSSRYPTLRLFVVFPILPNSHFYLFLLLSASFLQFSFHFGVPHPLVFPEILYSGPQTIFQFDLVCALIMLLLEGVLERGLIRLRIVRYMSSNFKAFLCLIVHRL